jgi:hypothetical protein
VAPQKNAIFCSTGHRRRQPRQHLTLQNSDGKNQTNFQKEKIKRFLLKFLDNNSDVPAGFVEGGDV